jgi:hypothetical protein
VGSICQTLAVAASTYYAATGRAPSARQRRDERLAGEILRVYHDNFGVYGAAQDLAAAVPRGHRGGSVYGRAADGLYWDEKRQRWIAAVVLGYTPSGKRVMRRGSGKTKTEAKNKLREVLRDHEDGLHSMLNRAITRAMARDKVKRNVVTLCSVPTGQPGRLSKALTLDQAKAILNAAEDSRVYAYVVLSLLIGARTEELRALT